MNIEIIRGAIGSGKTDYIFKSIKKELEKSGTRQLIVVPEQFSYETEKKAAELFGGTGLNNIEVVTLSRLVFRDLSDRVKNRLTPPGKLMIAYEAVNSLSEDNIFYGCAKKPGFLQTASDMISELLEYMITPELLKKSAERIGTGLLPQKLISLAELLEEYIKLFDGRFFDSEQDILALSEYAEESGAYSGCDFWFDEFSVLLPQHYRLMRALLSRGSKIHVSVCIDSAERELYGVNKLILNKLNRLSESLAIKPAEHRTDDRCRSIKSPELLFLAENIDRPDTPDAPRHTAPTSDISLFVCKDLYREVRRAALLIRRLVMEEGLRYRDISVVLANSEAYEHIIQAVFSDYGIPYFSDTRLCVAEHPISTLLFSVFDILAKNWSYPCVIRLLRTGFFFTKQDGGEVCALDDESIDLLENYILKYGIRGKSVWLDDDRWHEAQKGFFDAVISDRAPFSAEELEKINLLRSTVTAPFRRLYGSASGRRTVRELAGATFEFLEDIHLYEGIEKVCDEFDGAGKRNEAEQLRRVWNILIEVLDQCVVVMGEKKCSREEFSDIVSAGLSAVDISIIPSGLDRVSVSSVERSRQQSSRVMLILGAVLGAIPAEHISTGILTDLDRAVVRDELSHDGFEIAAESEIRNETDKFNFFSTLFGVSEKVFISYPAADSEGNTMRPAPIISDLFRLFPNLSSGDNLISEDEEEIIYSPRAAYQYMLSCKGQATELSRAVYSWFSDNMPEKLEVIKKASEYKRTDAHISPENAKRLYSDRSAYSISRLNEYGECPFSYFVKYGLKAREQEIRQIRKFDLGSIMHMALERYCRAVDGNSESYEELRNNWLSLSVAESEALADKIMQELEEKIVAGAVRDENKLKYIIMRMGRMVKRAVEAVRKSLVAGEYAAVCYEQKFRVNVTWGDKTVPVDGVVDRIDLAEFPEKKLAELRVADYKTGKKEFSVVSICNRQDMQLVMYAVAAVEMYRSGIIKYSKSDFEPCMRAILYNRMHDDLTEGATAEEAKKAQVFASRPDGLLVLDREDSFYDTAAAIRMDNALSPSSESEIFRVKLNADSSISRNSQVTSTDAFGLLGDYVKKSVIEADGEIFDGIIKIYPACAKNTSACDWCDFGEVCLYNKKFDSARPLVQKEEDAWDIIRKEVQKDEQA